ncbi:MAG: hypothetical protein K8I30_14605, partial [Anaerolineae bacterium]|nr:hypothetical protein [Anaerolineae bacterium]
GLWSAAVLAVVRRVHGSDLLLRDIGGNFALTGENTGHMRHILHRPVPPLSSLHGRRPSARNGGGFANVSGNIREKGGKIGLWW